MNSSPYEQMIKAKRENYRNEIRKQDIGLKMSLKRQIIFEQTQNSMTLIESNFSKFLSTFKFMERYTDPKDVPNKNYFEIYQEILKTLMDEDYKGNIIGILCCLVLYRKLSMESSNMSISSAELIRSGLVLYLEKYTNPDFISFPEIQAEACWIIANIIAPENMDLSFLWSTKIATNLVALLKSANREVFYNAIWSLSNLFGDSLDYRNKLLSSELIECLIALIKRLKNKQDAKFDRHALGEVVWLVGNLCRGKPYPPYDEVSKFLEVLPDCFNVLDLAGIENALWTFVYLTDSEEYKIKNFMKLNLIGMLVSLAKEDENKLKIPALRVLGNISTSDDQYVSILLDNNILDVLQHNLNEPNKFLRKEVSWILANIVSGGSTIVQRVMDHEIFNLMRQKSISDEIIVRRELIIAFSNATQNSMYEQILHLIDRDLIYILMSGLEIQDPKIILSILDAFDNLLEANHECNKMRNEINRSDNHIFEELEKSDIHKVLDGLQQFPLKEVQQKVLQIVDRHFAAGVLG